MNKKATSKIETVDEVGDLFASIFEETFERYTTNRYNLSKAPLPMQEIYRSILREQDRKYILDNMIEYVNRLNNEEN